MIFHPVPWKTLPIELIISTFHRARRLMCLQEVGLSKSNASCTVTSCLIVILQATRRSIYHSLPLRFLTKVFYTTISYHTLAYDRSRQSRPGLGNTLKSLLKGAHYRTYGYAIFPTHRVITFP